MPKKQSLCLNMIVKNEAKIIVSGLEKLCSKISFDYWVICDTGSDDSTQDLIRNFFKEKTIPGKLIEEPWVDFGHNRSVALAHAFRKSDYLLIWDADDELNGEFKMPKLTADAYSMRFANSQTNLVYYRTVLLNNTKKWIFVGVLHEYLAYKDLTKTLFSEKLPGLTNYSIQSGRFGARNQDPQKFIKDAQILEKALLTTDVQTTLYGRYAFYCGNSYFNTKMYKESIPFYEKAIQSKSWIQEKYVSCLRIYESYDQLKQEELGLPYLEQAFQYDSTRIECIFRLIKYYCIKKQNETCLEQYKKIQNYYENNFLDDTLAGKLFIYSLDYNYYFPYYMIIVSERTKQYRIGIKMYEIIFTKGSVEPSDWYMHNLFHNLQFFLPHLCEHAPFNLKMKSYIEKLKKRGYEFQLTAKNYIQID